LDKFMYQHFKNIEYLYGDAYVQIPNGVFKDLSSHLITKNKTNIQQVSFAYAYLVVIAFLYKYAHFVDIDNGTYIQNADIKQLLGYSRTTKTVDGIIKKNGILDMIGLTETIRNYPILFMQNPTETVNDIPLREYVYIKDIDDTDVNYSTIRKIVKNGNYETKEPTFLFVYKEESGTLYDYSNTHKVTIKELMSFMYSEGLNNIDFLLYCYFKSKCKGYKGDMRAISLNHIQNDLGIGRDAFYGHLDVLKSNGLIDVIHKGWVMGSQSELEGNEYCFKGVATV
jgi:predicted DNA-binding transcriptional regulator